MNIIKNGVFIIIIQNVVLSFLYTINCIHIIEFDNDNLIVHRNFPPGNYDAFI